MIYYLHAQYFKYIKIGNVSIYDCGTMCKRIGLSVNPNKTVAILLIKRRKLKGLGLLIIWGSGMTVRTEVKYMGIILNTKNLTGHAPPPYL